MADDEPENLTLNLLREMRAEQERSATHAAVVYKLRFSFVHIGAPTTRIGARESQPIQCLQHVFGRTLTAPASLCSVSYVRKP